MNLGGLPVVLAVLCAAVIGTFAIQALDVRLDRLGTQLHRLRLNGGRVSRILLSRRGTSAARK